MTEKLHNKALVGIDLDEFFNRFIPGASEELKAEVEDACGEEGLPIEDFVARFMKDATPEEQEEAKRELFELSAVTEKQIQMIEAITE